MKIPAITILTHGGQQYLVNAYFLRPLREGDLPIIRVWMPSSYTGNHHTITTFTEFGVNGVWGDVTTERMPCDLPVGEARFQFYTNARAEQVRRAIAIAQNALGDKVSVVCDEGGSLRAKADEPITLGEGLPLVLPDADRDGLLVPAVVTAADGADVPPGIALFKLKAESFQTTDKRRWQFDFMASMEPGKRAGFIESVESMWWWSDIRSAGSTTSLPIGPFGSIQEAAKNAREASY